MVPLACMQLRNGRITGKRERERNHAAPQPRLGACSERAAVTEESGRGGQGSCNAISSAHSDGNAANGSDGVRM